MSKLRDRAVLLRDVRSVKEALVLLQIHAVAMAVPLVMRLSLPRLGRVVVRPARRSRRAPHPDPERLRDLVTLAQRTGAPLVRTGCVTRGVTLLWLLRRRGLDVQLAFGIGGPADDHYGHCWLVRDDRPYLEPNHSDGRFVEQYRIPTTTPVAR